MSAVSALARFLVQPTPRRFNARISTLLVVLAAVFLIASVLVLSFLLGDAGIRSDFTTRLSAPGLTHLFGTDFMGRDVFARTMHGLTLSLWVGLSASLISTLIAAILALIAVVGGRLADETVALMVDAVLGLPHILLLMLIAFALGGGTSAVIIAVAVTHWPRLTRILRAEILQLKYAEYVQISRGFGKSWFYIARYHMLPHLVPQMLVGMILMFPHAILHEAGLTFLGFGLEPSRPAIGILLSESMRTLSAGYWWLGLFPGIALLIIVLCFDALGNGLRKLIDPRSSQE